MARTDYFKFLDALAANNDRAWFQAHRAEYEAIRDQWLEDLQKLINALAGFRPELRTLAPKDCTYRIYRDVRFSPDKSPYKRHLGALIAPNGRRCTDACIYLQVAADGFDTGVYGGLWMPNAAQKRKVRSAIDADANEFAEIADALGLAGKDNSEKVENLIKAIDELKEKAASLRKGCGESLKTAPKGWPKDHPMIQYLRLNEWGRFAPMSRKDFDSPAWIDIATEHIHALMPLVDFLNFSIHEDNAL